MKLTGAERGLIAAAYREGILKNDPELLQDEVEVPDLPFGAGPCFLQMSSTIRVDEDGTIYSVTTVTGVSGEGVAVPYLRDRFIGYQAEEPIGQVPEATVNNIRESITSFIFDPSGLFGKWGYYQS